MTELVFAIDRIREEGFELSFVCQVLNVSRASYYRHQRKLPSLREQEDRRLSVLVENLFRKHKRRYGVRRITKTLQAQGEQCGMTRIARLMKQQGLKAIQPKSFQPKTTKSKHKCLSTITFPAH